MYMLIVLLQMKWFFLFLTWHQVLQLKLFIKIFLFSCSNNKHNKMGDGDDNCQKGPKTMYFAHNYYILTLTYFNYSSTFYVEKHNIGLVVKVLWNVMGWGQSECIACLTCFRCAHVYIIHYLVGSLILVYLYSVVYESWGTFPKSIRGFSHKYFFVLCFLVVFDKWDRLK